MKDGICYTRNVYKCSSDEERKELKKLVRKRYYQRNKEKIRELNKLNYLKRKKEQEQEQ